MLFVLAFLGAAAHADAGSGAAVPLEDRHLPTAVNAPGTWSDDEGVRGPVAALGVATRTRPVGLFDEKKSLALFAVSATDGSASWVRTPGFSLERWHLDGGFAVSPDGQWVGWVRPQGSRRPSSTGRVAGWSVMDTTTGHVRRLDLPDSPWVRGTMADLAFSGDSRYLLTSYEVPDRPRVRGSRAHQLVAWDVEDGTPTVVEEPGPYWLPNLGSAPSGVTWARGRQVFRVDPDTGSRTTVTLPQHVVTASWGPDDEGFAYIGRPSVRSTAPWRLYAGRSIAEARRSPVALPSGIDPAQLLGWVDATHVVVGRFRTVVHVVDVVTGEVEAIDLAGDGEQVNAPVVAGALWQQPLVAPVEPDGTRDPRRPWLWSIGALAVLVAGVLLAREHRPGGARHRAGPTYDGGTPPPPSLRPLATAATGLVLVLVDLRLEDRDVIPDPVGWLLAAWALSSLRTAHRGFGVAGIAAWLAVVPSVPEWSGPESPLVGLATSLAQLVVLFATCTALIGVSPARRHSASAIRWLTVGLVGAVILASAAAAPEPGLGLVALAAGAGVLGVAVWFLVLLFSLAKEAAPATSSPRNA